MTGKAVRFALIGPGKVGSSVATALNNSGWVCTAIVYKTHSRGELETLKNRFPKARLTGSLEQLPPDFEVLFIAVKDDQIPHVVSDLSSRRYIDWKGKTVLHFSGVVELAALSKLRAFGASTGALHPISPFAARFSPDRARQTFYDFLGENAALNTASKITRRLHSKIIMLRSEEDRILLHAASVIASNSVVIAVKSADNILSDVMRPDDSRAVLGTLLSSTVDNISSNRGFDALTGPLVRGDLSVIAKHVEALKGNRQLLQFYKSSQLLGIEGLLQGQRDRSLRESLKKIKKLLEK